MAHRTGIKADFAAMIARCKKYDKTGRFARIDWYYAHGMASIKDYVDELDEIQRTIRNEMIEAGMEVLDF